MGQIDSEYQMMAINRWYYDNDGPIRRIRGAKLQYKVDGQLATVSLSVGPYIHEDYEACTKLMILVWGLP